MGSIEQSLHCKEYVLGAFLNIEGAFNNVTSDSILGALSRLGINHGVINLVKLILQDRIVQAGWGDCKVSKRVSRGTPQGGVLSPLL